MDDNTIHRRILGVDPGTNIMGYAVLDTELNKSSVEVLSVLQMTKLGDPYAKLKFIYEKINGLIAQYHPDTLAIEAPFYGKNVQSMLKLGRAQGIVIAASMHAGMEVQEYSPRKIKQSITGNGNASKEQLAAMLSHLLDTPSDSRFLDATDALGIALCHHYESLSLIGASSGNRVHDWAQFLEKNKDRIV